MTDFLYQPKDADGPVFKAPWEATAFGLVLALHKAGAFTWAEWASYLTGAIESAQASGDADIGDTYYEHWLAALECITSDKGLTNPEMLAERKQKAHEEHQRLHHGHTH